MTSAAREVPPIVYLPCIERVTDPADAVIELRRTKDGRTALLAYSAFDRFQRCCGDLKPWVALPSAALEALHRTDPFDLLLLDVVMPEGQVPGQ
ncbi:SAV_915 family protein [Rhodococcus sp. 105337]|uniref:SAV_915 family protein n=1 Tax=unclassified Rhodococcus (in: high G+C Gram-positive bacteria) TaxID=192944 RepID=UPI003211E6E6